MDFTYRFQKGEKIYNIIEGWASKNKADSENIIDEERKIEIGEELEFVYSYLDEKDKDKPYECQIMFKCKDGYVSNSGYFGIVTEEEWNNLKKYFKKCYQEDGTKNID